MFLAYYTFGNSTSNPDGSIRSWPGLDAPFDGNKCYCFFHPEAHQCLVKILYWQHKGPALFKVSSSTSQRRPMSLRTGLSMPIHVWNRFFHSLSLMNLDMFILECPWFVILYGCLRNEKPHTPSIGLEELMPNL